MISVGQQLADGPPELADLRVAKAPPDMIYYGHFYGH